MTDEHTDDVDPRGADFPVDVPEEGRVIETDPNAVCPICGEIHTEANE